MNIPDFETVPFGTLGRLIAAIDDMVRGGWFELFLNLSTLGAIGFAGWKAGRFIVRRNVAAAFVAAALATPVFAGYGIGFYVIGFGAGYVAFLAAVGTEAYFRLTEGEGYR